MSDTTNTPPEEVTQDVTTQAVENNEPKLTDKEFNFRALETKAKELEKENKRLKAEQQAKLEAELAEQGKLKELAELKAQEAEKYKKELDQYRFDSQLQNEILKSGVNPKFLKFVQTELKEAVKLNENGELENLTETLSRLKTEYAEWFAPQPIASFGSDKTTAPNANKTSSAEIMEIMNSGNAELIAKNAEKIYQAFK